MIKDTKTHQMRIVNLDPETVAILTVHKQRVQQRCAELGTTLPNDAFVFSYATTTGGTATPTPSRTGTPR